MMSRVKPPASSTSVVLASHPLTNAHVHHHRQPGLAPSRFGSGHAIKTTSICLKKQRSLHITRGLVVAAAAAPAGSQVRVRLVVPEQPLQFGEQIKCVGGDTALGNWYDKAAPFLSWTEGDNWIHHTSLPSGSHTFKLMLQKDGGEVFWEEGADRTIEIPEGVSGTVEVTCAFNDTTATWVEVVEDEDSSEDEGSAGSLNDESASSQGTESASGQGDDKQLQSQSAGGYAVSHDDDSDHSEGEEPAAPVEASKKDAGDLPPVVEQSMFVDEVEEDVSQGDAPEAPPPPVEEVPQASVEIHEPEPPVEVKAPAAQQPEHNPSPEASPAPRGNGSDGFKTFTKAKAKVLEDKSMLVTFDEESDNEDAETLAQRLFSSS